MLELTEKQPLEERTEAAQNGLKVVEPEPDAGMEAEGQIVPSAGEPVPESVTPPSNMDLPVPLKEDPAQSSQSDAHLTSQDMRRAKRIRVRRSERSLCSLTCNSGLDCCYMVSFQQCVSLPQYVLPSKMDVQVGGTRRMSEKH